MGAVAAGLAEGTSLLDAARMGTELASLVCQAEGAQGYAVDGQHGRREEDA